MVQAVVCVGDGHSYEQTAISEWLQTHDTSPVTGQPLATTDLLPNHALRQMIQLQARGGDGDS
jgi:U-box domain